MGGRWGRGQGRRRAAVGVAVLPICLALSIASPTASARPWYDDRPAGGLLPPSYAAKYAPEFRFDKDEDYWPVDIDWFIRKSRLVFASPKNCTTAATRDLPGYGEINPRRLGGKAGDRPDNVYEARKFKRKRISRGKSRCVATGRKFQADEFTRPRDNSVPRPANLSDDFGFALDLDNDVRRAAHEPRDATTPLYYAPGWSAAHGYYIRYFVMYTCSGLAVKGHRDRCVHEGEWEGITVLLGKNPDGRKPTTVFYNQHNNGTLLQRRYNIPRADWGAGGRTHPIVFTADDTHASYHYPGGQSTCYVDSKECAGTDVFDGKGPRWRPRRLVNVLDEPWFRFGGAWGNVGGSALSTGPAGPAFEREGSGFPAPWTFSPVAFPPGSGDECIPRLSANEATYPGRCFRKKDHADARDFLDLDCKNIPYRQFAVWDVFPRDPHNFDGDGDGFGCEKSGNRAGGGEIYEDEQAGVTGEDEGDGNGEGEDVFEDEGDAIDGDVDGDGEVDGNIGGGTGGGGQAPSDTDGDGFADNTDACPTVAGAAPNGCPVGGSNPSDPDSDGDGVPDRFDSCPTTPGVSPGGCPPPPGCPSDTVGARKGQTHRRRLPYTGFATSFEATYSSFGRSTYKFSVEPTSGYWNITIPANNATGTRLNFRYKAYNGPTPCPSEGTVTIVVQ